MYEASLSNCRPAAVQARTACRRLPPSERSVWDPAERTGSAHRHPTACPGASSEATCLRWPHPRWSGRSCGRTYPADCGAGGCTAGLCGHGPAGCQAWGAGGGGGWGGEERAALHCQIRAAAPGTQEVGVPRFACSFSLSTCCIQCNHLGVLCHTKEVYGGTLMCLVRVV